MYSREIHDTICQSSGTQLEEETESLGLRETSTTSLLYNTIYQHRYNRVHLNST